MHSSSTGISFQTWFFFFLFAVFFKTLVCSSKISYSDHCSSIVPESSPTVREYENFTLLRARINYYTGGDRILGNDSSDLPFFSDKFLSFRTTPDVYKTATEGVYKIKAYFTNSGSRMYRRTSSYGLLDHRKVRGRSGYLSFLLDGFWSESSGKLCMVGSASWFSTQLQSLNLDAVLRLKYAKNSIMSTSLVTGELESLSSPGDPSYFEPISMLALPEMTHYNYTLASKEFNDGCPGATDVPGDPSLRLEQGRICAMLSRGSNTLELVYAGDCNSSRNCTPFSEGIGYLPPTMSLYAIQCSKSEQKLRYLIEFSNSSDVGYYPPFNLNTTLVGEGYWDGKKNRLCIVACRILNPTPFGNAHVGDCSTRLSLRYPAIWTIRNSTNIVGQVWTNKTVGDSGYFDKIFFRSSVDDMVQFPDLKYRYTEIDRAKKYCPVKKPVKKKHAERYPDGHSYDMRFDMSFRNSHRIFAWGSAIPISVGDELYERYSMMNSGSDQVIADAVVDENTNYSAPLNISYKIRFYGIKFRGGVSSSSSSLSPDGRVEISAEGIYDAETGHLCMVGCRKQGSYNQNSNNDSLDCEILVTFQFPPLNGRTEGFIKGSIESLRNKTDPHYFEHLNVSATALYATEARRSIWRMDLEIMLVLLLNTLACIFVALQIFYVKKHPDVLQYISLVMLVNLTLGHMIPLLLNFEALFFQNRDRQSVLLWNGGWLEVNEVIVRFITMVAFLLQVRLLQLSWTARLGDGNGKGLWVAEKKSLFVFLPFYILGGLIVLYMNWNTNQYNNVMASSWNFVEQHSLWGDLRSYAGLVLDGFLLPQILLNIFQVSKESALSHPFYIGTTVVRLVPHAYDLYRTHNYDQLHFEGSYIFADHSADFYSSAWDVIIPCGCVLFAVVLYLQQRFGGRCILPPRFRELEAYKKVPATESSSP